MPPLHIELGITKQLVKVHHHEAEGFTYLKVFFSKLSEAKIKGGIFVGYEIKKLMNCEIFLRLLNKQEKKPGTVLAQ